MHYQNRFIVLLITAAISLCGCTSYIAKYPSSWPIVNSIYEGDCPSLSGIYKNKGEEAFTNKVKYISPVYLGEQYFPNILYTEDVDPKWASHLEVNQHGDESITITLLDNDNVIYKKTLNREKDYECKDSYLIIKRKYTSASEFGPTWSKTTKYFTQTINGSTVVKVEYSKTGTMLLVIVGNETTVSWYIFESSN